MKMPKIIEILDVWKTYQMGKVRVNALCGLSFSVEKGDFVAIQGPSGSGKSTAMNIIGCLDIPTKGTVLLNSTDISTLDENSLAQIRGKTIGFVFQQFNLIHTMTAKENVSLPMIFQGVSHENRMERASRLLELVGLKDRINHRPSEMSGGEQQRVAIARALANNPDVILADEPTGNLDSKTGRLIIELLAKLHREENKTIIIVTHDETVASYAERIEFLRDGRIVESKSSLKKQG